MLVDIFSGSLGIHPGCKHQTREDTGLSLVHENNTGLLLVFQLCRPEDAFPKHCARLPVFENLLEPFQGINPAGVASFDRSIMIEQRSRFFQMDIIVEISIRPLQENSVRINEYGLLEPAGEHGERLHDPAALRHAVIYSSNGVIVEIQYVQSLNIRGYHPQLFPLFPRKIVLASIKYLDWYCRPKYIAKRSNVLRSKDKISDQST